MIILNKEKLPKKLKAVVLEKKETLKVKEIPLWSLKSYKDSDLVLVKVKSCGICGSDLRYFKGENPWAQHTLGKYIPNLQNIVLGHEFSGDVVAVLDEKNNHLLGKRVAPVCSKVCGVCIYCRSGRENLCPNTMHIGHGQGWGNLDYYPGAYTEYVPVWAKGCYEIPENLSYDEAAMMDILAVCTRVANQGRIKQGGTVLIMGCGPAGNGISQIARILGAGKVIVTGRSDLTLNLARRQKIDLVIDTKGKNEEQIKKIIMKETNRCGCSSVFDSIGTKESLTLGLSVLDKGGTLVNMAIHNESIEFNGMAIGAERTITTACNFHLHEYPITLSWLAQGRINVDGWISNITLDDVPKIFRELINRKKGRKIFKVVINP